MVMEDGWERLELWIFVFLFIYFIPFLRGWIWGYNKENFYLNLEFLRIFLEVRDAFVQSLIHKSLKSEIFR